MKFESYEISSAQKRIYLVDQFQESCVMYNIPTAKIIEGDLSRHRLEAAIQKLIQRHEILRTSFSMKDGEIVQNVYETIDFNLDYTLLAPLEIDEVIEQFVQPFDLGSIPLWRAGLFGLDKGRHLFLFDIHHIIADGMSIDLIFNEMMVFYQGNDLPPLDFQYVDFTIWQNDLLESSEMENQETYWLEQFHGEIPVLQLITDYPRAPQVDPAADIFKFEIGIALKERLNQLAVNHNTTLFIVLLAAYNILLSKYTGQEDIVIGAPIAGRRHPQLEMVVGMFVNTLPLRNRVVSSQNLAKFLQDMSQRTFLAFENQDYPFERLVEKLNVERQLNRNPLFDTVFALQNFAKDSRELVRTLETLRIIPYPLDNKLEKFDSSLLAVEEKGKIFFKFRYRTSLFKREGIKTFMARFIRILCKMTGGTDLRIGEIEIISTKEKEFLLNSINNTGTDYPADKTLQQLFTGQVARTPDTIAVVGIGQGVRGIQPALGDLQLSYRRLNEMSNQLVHVLQEKGVVYESIVGVLAEASPEAVAAVLAVLKAGGAYLPIDPDYPDERIQYLLAESGAKVVFLDKAMQQVGEDRYTAHVLSPSSISPVSRKPQETCHLPPSMNFSNLAYIIYTSGSTGRPKGVMVEHRNVIRLVKNTNYITFHENDRILQTGALEFDASTFEIWGALLNGFSLYLVPRDRMLVPNTLKEIIRKHQITVMWMTSPLFNRMVQSDVEIFAHLENLLVGGDVLSSIHINRVKKRFPHLKLINGYGPTENTTFSTTFLIDKEYKVNIPIGKPIANSTAYIVDKNDKLQPIGIVGELYVGGDGVSRGYLNNPELTAEKFNQDLWNYRDYHDEKKEVEKIRSLEVKNTDDGRQTTDDRGQVAVETTFNEKLLRGVQGGGFLEKSPPGRRRQKTYKTGDLARWLANGNIEFLGRMDHQIKIRGYRIEPGEVENHLMNHTSIKQAVVLAKEDNNKDKYLCAYIVSDREIPGPELREFLSVNLPEYMIPSYFGVLGALPLTPNGKVDRKALPEPERVTGESYVAPRDEIEKQLVRLWSDVLGIEVGKIGIDDNFFGLGGHSLKATIVMAKIHKELKVKLPLGELFRVPNIRHLSEYIRGEETVEYLSIEPVEKKEYYDLSSAQKRIYIMQQANPGGIEFNMPGVFLLRGKLSRQKFEKVFAGLIQRHEILRTSFFPVNGQEVQKVHHTLDFKVKYYTCSEAEAIPRISQFIKPFDLNYAPLLRVKLIQIEKETYYIFLDMHHIITDGSSMETLVHEFSRLYKGKELTPLPIQYKDYAAWQGNTLQKEALKQQERYWLKKMEGFMFTRIPVDKFAAYKRVEGRRKSLKIEQPIFSKVEKFCHKHGITRFVFMITVFEIILARETDQTDITIATPVSIKDHLYLKDLIGIFLNILLIRLTINKTDMFLNALAKNKQVVTEALNTRYYPYELLNLKIREKYNLKRDELFSVFFNYFPKEENLEIATDDFKISPLELTEVSPKYDMTLYVFDPGDFMKLDLVYKANIYDQCTIESILEGIDKVIRLVLKNENAIINALNPFDDEEENFEPEFEEYAEEEFMF